MCVYDHLDIVAATRLGNTYNNKQLVENWDALILVHVNSLHTELFLQAELLIEEFFMDYCEFF